MNFSIKKASLKNISQIVKIHRRCVLETNAKFYSETAIKEWINQISKKTVRSQFKNSLWYLLKTNNKIVGFSQFSLKEKTLYQINIDPKYHNKGFGRLLYEFVESQFRKNHIKKISLNSTLNAFKFYKNLGFKSLGKIKFKLGKVYIKMIKMQENLI